MTRPNITALTPAVQWAESTKEHMDALLAADFTREEAVTLLAASINRTVFSSNPDIEQLMSRTRNLLDGLAAE